MRKTAKSADQKEAERGLFTNFGRVIALMAAKTPLPVPGRRLGLLLRVPAGWIDLDASYIRPETRLISPTQQQSSRLPPPPLLLLQVCQTTHVHTR